VPTDDAALAQLLGLDRDADYMDAEREEPELLYELVAADAPPADLAAWTGTDWQGRANRLDRHPMYRWPVIDAVAAATRAPAPPQAALAALPTVLVPPPGDGRAAAQLIRSRRSAQRFDARRAITASAFLRIAAALADTSRLPLDAWPRAPRVHIVLFLHRVEGFAPGAYLLARNGNVDALRAALGPGLAWQPAAALPLYLLAENTALAGTLRTLSCHQALGSDCGFAVAMLAEFEPVLADAPWRYRDLYRECGLLGQLLYLEAEAAGLAGTGIGCYFDDAVHQLLELADRRFQVLYHFTVGHPLMDARITSEPPYADRQIQDPPTPTRPCHE